MVSVSRDLTAVLSSSEDYYAYLQRRSQLLEAVLSGVITTFLGGHRGTFSRTSALWVVLCCLPRVLPPLHIGEGERGETLEGRAHGESGAGVRERGDLGGSYTRRVLSLQ